MHGISNKFLLIGTLSDQVTALTFAVTTTSTCFDDKSRFSSGNTASHCMAPPTRERLSMHDILSVCVIWFFGYVAGTGIANMVF